MVRGCFSCAQSGVTLEFEVRIRCIHTVCVVCLLLPSLASAQLNGLPPASVENAAFFEKHDIAHIASFYQSSASPWIDVTYYKLQLDISTAEGSLTGHCTVQGICRSDTAGPLVLDLRNTMNAGPTYVNGVRTSFVQGPNTISITLDRPYRAGDTLTADIYYAGTPSATGFGSFEFATHFGTPWVYSLSEPSGARDWWPCKDDPSDKADSSDVIVTCDSTFKVGSNGVLVSTVNNGNGTATYHWQERYPIASYLISIALTNFSQFSNWFRYSPTDSMEVLNYVLPEHLGPALAQLPKTVDMLTVYSNLFGLYPFVKEKYGHSEFGSGGAMEHQTMTSTTTFDEDVISHELGHQWFGDMITCRTWGDIWLNEGFAQYCSALYREKEYGTDSYWLYMNYQMSMAVSAVGAIGIPDTSSVRNLFDGARIYSKGATVLHMLRHVLGDSVFFRAMRAYANNPALRYSTATTRDFETACETASGEDLSYFFREWIYGEGFPTYGYLWHAIPSGDGYEVTIDLEQSQTGGNPAFFTMPVDFQLRAGAWDTTVTFFNNAQSQVFVLHVPFSPSTVMLDPEGWILKLAFADSNVPPSQYSLEQNYPNPFNPKTTIVFHVPTQSFVTLAVYDVLGRHVATILDHELKSAGLYTAVWKPVDVASGVYFYRLTAQSRGAVRTGDFVQTRKMVYVK